jgi:hypothetical protein
MKRIIVPATCALTLALLGGCQTEDQPKPQKKTAKPTPSSTTQIANNPNPEETQGQEKPSGGETSKAQSTPAPNPVPNQQTPAQGEIPYAKPVPGKPGFVFSPYDQYKGYIDVRGFPPGTEVKDPYSGKSFLVP